MHLQACRQLLLRFGLILFWWICDPEKLRNQKLPLHDSDGNIRKENEPRDWVEAAVERHVGGEWKASPQVKEKQTEEA